MVELYLQLLFLWLINKIEVNNLIGLIIITHGNLAIELKKFS